MRSGFLISDNICLQKICLVHRGVYDPKSLQQVPPSPNLRWGAENEVLYA